MSSGTSYTVTCHQMSYHWEEIQLPDARYINKKTHHRQYRYFRSGNQSPLRGSTNYTLRVYEIRPVVHMKAQLRCA